ncbi:MAG: hypothetical protein C4583_15540 [Anaerolineaceae bacterium]|nr:MAG: hypothetical protein C4583_15540 [Anaerolineaceae bacterium]
MNRKDILLRGSLSLLIGLGLSLALGMEYFDFQQKNLLDRVFLVGAPTVAFTILLWLAFPSVRAHVSKPVLVSGGMAVLPAIVHLCLIQRAFSEGWKQMVLAAILMLFYGSIIFLSRWRILQSWRQVFRVRVLLTLGIFLLFDAGVIVIALQFPNLFHPEQFLPPMKNLGWILFGLLAGLAALGGLVDSLLAWPWLTSRKHALGDWVDENLPGLLAAALVFPAYFILAHGFNPPVDGLSLNNTFFASDTYFWQVRFGTEQGYPIGRAVHPLALLILRAASWMLAFVHGGDWRLGALLLVAITASACAFLAWTFVYQTTHKASYALLFSGMLALSAAHLVFGSVTETYIFSAFGLLLFFVFLLSKTRPVKQFLLPGLLTLGITITNVVQSLLAFLIVRRDGRQWLQFATLVASVGIALTTLTALIYPGHIGLFFVPSDLLLETKHASHLEAGAGLPERFVLVSKNIFLYDVAAVPPTVTRVDKEDRPPFPKFNFFHPPYGLREYGYSRLGYPTLALWLILLLAAMTRFFWRGGKSPHFSFQLALLAVLALNLFMHLFYGFEPFLYTPNWTYALLFFVALSLDDLPKQAWLEWGLLAFLFLLLVNNGLFLRLLAGNLSPYFPALGG